MAKKVTTKSLQKELTAFVVREVVKKNKRAFQQRITVAFDKIKQEMLEEFLAHPVSIEIEGGPHAENSSGTLDGYGNLFSFIGFNEGDSPLEPIVELLQSTRIELGSETDTGFLMKIFVPSKEDIFSVTPMPWASGRSWAEGIERGISGFGRYLKTDSVNSSRSGGGIEVQSVIRRGKFKNTPYISALINKYAKKFQQINNTVVLTGIL
jgi:hypothetical protein